MLEKAAGEMAWPCVLTFTICAAINARSRRFNLSKAEEKKWSVHVLALISYVSLGKAQQE